MHDPVYTCDLFPNITYYSETFVQQSPLGLTTVAVHRGDLIIQSGFYVLEINLGLDRTVIEQLTINTGSTVI